MAIGSERTVSVCYNIVKEIMNRKIKTSKYWRYLTLGLKKLTNMRNYAN